MEITGLDLFAGAGGLSLGLAEAGVKVVAANEIDPDSCNTYRANHESVELLEGDIKDIDFRNWNGVDLICGGPPCQGFSTLGKKQESDFRNSLYMQFVRALKETKCSAFCFENVSGFHALYGGEIFTSFLREVDKLGFKSCPCFVETSDFGIPQYRKRTIILGIKDMSVSFEFANTSNARKKLLSLMDAISDLPELLPGEEATEYSSPPVNQYQKKMRRRSKKLADHSCSSYGPKMQKILASIPEGGSVADLPEELRPAFSFANTYARLRPDEPSPTITRNLGTPSSSRCVHPYQNRALSTREGARLQSFPDHFVFTGSRTSKNLQIGNAIPPVLGSVLGSWLGQLFQLYTSKTVCRRRNATNLKPPASAYIPIQAGLFET